jgi:NAD(P)H-dependent flavin oxidoreductase YrpB (nitropropane dioxygenase family)
MGIGVSDWRLARAVSRLGHLGVVSGVAVNTLMVRRLQQGDEGGRIRRALEQFPDADTAREILEACSSRPRAAGAPFDLCPMPTLRPGRKLQRWCAAAAFVEVRLAKQDHDGIVGINFLEKLALSNLAALYGSMLAGVDYVLMGAGIPRDLPDVLESFARHEPAELRVPVTGAEGEVAVTRFDPAEAFPDLDRSPLRKPRFLAIVSSAVLAQHLLRSTGGRIDGFVVEGATAGGHNAPPRGPMRIDERGEPIYGPRDVPDLAAMRELGRPFWLAGSWGSPEKLREARALGAAGIQVGTAFAFCEESGLAAPLKRAALRKWGRAGAASSERVFTDPLASPTRFPFKVVPLEGTLSRGEVYAARPRHCDLGYLRQVARDASGKLVYRCPAEPEDDYVRKGGERSDTVGCKCLCNALLANVGLGQTRPEGSVEPPLVTAGDDLAQLARYVRPGAESYAAADVVALLTG